MVRGIAFCFLPKSSYLCDASGKQRLTMWGAGTLPEAFLFPLPKDGGEGRMMNRTNGAMRAFV